MIQQNTTIQNLAGIDITQNYLDAAKENLGCQIHLGSILDEQLCQNIGPQYDYAIMGAVLHHLVGPTRTISKRNAQRAVTNALVMLKPGGHLLIYEPAHYPAFMMDIVFWIKRLCSMIAPRRIELGKKWFNLGLPVVSYFTNEQLLAMFGQTPSLEIVEKQYNDPKKLGFAIHRTSSTFILRKKLTSGHDPKPPTL
jgi:SAM-dependent methyltransferase